jgi:hypothetical protein
MADKPQTFENHVRFVPPFHVGVLGILVVNVLFQLARLYLAPRPSHVMDVLLALALVGLTFYARVFAVTVQDRVIRLEMRLRLREILPADLQPRIPELALSQLVALRFASDAEMPELVRQVLAGTLTGRTEIKKQIRSWQPDHLRA